jgi:hypothetical protein
MAADFGAKGPAKWRRGERISFLYAHVGPLVLLAALMLIGSLPLAMPYTIEEAAKAGADPSGSSAGPPCQPITEAAFNRGWTEDPLIFTFAGVTFARRRADADCSSGKHGLLGVVGPIYPTCKFDAPYQLAVIEHGKTLYYAVPPGHMAVVDAKPGDTRCVVTGHFDIYDLNH